jgi:hypothetical protein
MPTGKHDICFGIVPRERKEVKLTYQKRYVETKHAEDGRSLMMKKVLLKQEPEIEKPVQRNNLFRTD